MFGLGLFLWCAARIVLAGDGSSVVGITVGDELRLELDGIYSAAGEKPILPASLFIPDQVLQTERIDALTLSDRSRARLESAILSAVEADDEMALRVRSWQPGMVGDPSNCDSEILNSGQPDVGDAPWRGASSLVEIVNRPGVIAIVADIVAEMEGWDNRWDQPGTAVILSTDEVVKPYQAEAVAALGIIALDGAEIARQFSPGSIVSFVDYGGTAQVEGLMVCVARPKLRGLEKGKKVLVVGESLEEVSGHLVRVSYFPIEGDQVLPQRYKSVSERQAIPLSVLRDPR